MSIPEVKTNQLVIQRRDLIGWFFISLVIILLISPLFYEATGLGRSAAGLSAEISRLPDGTLVSSPKAEALHRLTLPMRLELLFIYPLLLLGFQFSGGSLALRSWLEQQVGSGRLAWLRRPLAWAARRFPQSWRQRVTGRDLVVTLLFVLVFELALSLIYLPFGFYRSFIVGHQFGLSTQTAAGWAADWSKGLVINLVMSGLTWTGLYTLMRLLPRRWPIPAGALLVLFSLVLTLITPILITPLFYEVQPLQDEALRNRILALADRAGMSVDTVEVIDASAKTTAVNAYFTGFFGAQRIVLYDNLLAGYTPDQIEVVLAHEMGHWRYHHVLLGLLGLAAFGWISLFALRWLLNKVWQPLALKGPADVAGMPYLLAIVAIVSMLTMPVENGITRYAERQADRFSLESSQKPTAFIELFEKFAVQNLSPVDVPAWEEFLFYTHPSLAERIYTAESLLEAEK